ncbi:MAG: YeiH family protein [Endomicrobiaceae bacterium]|nr:YeiH family protein [Endomicrobiaceae bacterium]
MDFVKNNFFGLVLCFFIALVSLYFGKIVPVVGGPVFGILLGMTITLFLNDKSSLQPGINFTSKKILQYAVILLGFGMNLTSVIKVGFLSLPIIISTIATSLTVAYIMYKLLKMERNISVLIGVGSSICGGSAIAATSPVVNAKDEEIAQAIAVIFLFNVIAALIFPTLGSLIGLSNDGFGLFAGTAINDTSSVTAATTVWDNIHSSNTLAFGTIVKLTRTLAIIPITLILAYVYAKRNLHNTPDTKVSIVKIFPFFILFFVLASIITTVFNLSPVLTDNIKELSKFFIIMAMAAIGLNTNIVKLVKTGSKPIFMGFSCWIAIAAISLAMQYVLRIL